MGGFFGAASAQDCVFDLFFGIDYHSHLGTKRGGMVVYGEGGFDRAIHNIENAPFRTKFDKDVKKMAGTMGIGCISDYEEIRGRIKVLPEPYFLIDRASVTVDDIDERIEFEEHLHIIRF